MALSMICGAQAPDFFACHCKKPTVTPTYAAETVTQQVCGKALKYLQQQPNTAKCR
jgi:hypothetical protein